MSQQNVVNQMNGLFSRPENSNENETKIARNKFSLKIKVLEKQNRFRKYLANLAIK